MTATEQKVREAARRYGVPEELAVRLARQESGIRQFTAAGSIIRSSAGALGVMQLMPATAAALGVDPYNEDQNIDGGIRYLRQMYRTFGDWKTAVAAYNAGPGTMRQVLQGRKPLPGETASHVLAIMNEPFFSAPEPAPSPPFSPGRTEQSPSRPGLPLPKMATKRGGGEHS